MRGRTIEPKAALQGKAGVVAAVAAGALALGVLVWDVLMVWGPTPQPVAGASPPARATGFAAAGVDGAPAAPQRVASGPTAAAVAASLTGGEAPAAAIVDGTRVVRNGPGAFEEALQNALREQALADKSPFGAK